MTNSELQVSSVYAAFNRHNGHMYIGVTSRGIENRVREHEYSANTALKDWPFSRAIRKYGITGFFWAELHLFEDHGDALAKEKELIDKYKPEYNLAPGGQPSPMQGKTHSEETRAKISLKVRANPSRYWQGKQRSEETKAKISATKREAPVNQKCLDTLKKYRGLAQAKSAEVRRRAVICIDTGKEFLNADEAAKYYNVSVRTITRCCYCRSIDMRKTKKLKLSFRYKDDIKNTILIDLKTLDLSL